MDIPTEETEYRSSESLNQSNLKVLEESPKDFKKIMDGELEFESTKDTERGDLVHKLDLQPELISKEYTVVDSEIPSHKSQIAFVDALPQAFEPDDQDIIGAYKQAYSVKGKSDEKVEKEAKEIYEKYKEYYQALTGDREIITRKEYDTAAKAANAASSHPVIGNMLKQDENSLIEFPIEFAIDDSGFTRSSRALNERSEDLKYDFTHLYNRVIEKGNPISLKAKLDKVDINYESKTVKVLDLKSTKMSFRQFQDKFFDYDMDLQAGVYTEAIYYYLHHELGYSHAEVGEFHVEFYFAVININKPEARLFHVSDQTTDRGIAKMLNILNDYVWHVDNGLWEAKAVEYEKGGIEI
jgi:hypothetical protein